MFAESGILHFGIMNRRKQTFLNLETTEVELWIQYLGLGVHIPESGIQDCHGLPYMVQQEILLETLNVIKSEGVQTLMVLL